METAIQALPEIEQRTFIEKVADGLTYNLYSVIYRTAKLTTFCPMDICITCILVFLIASVRLTVLIIGFIVNFLVWTFYTLLIMSPALVILFLLVIVGVVIYYLSETIRSTLNIVATPLWNGMVQGVSGFTGALHSLVGAVLAIPRSFGFRINNPLPRFGPNEYLITDGIPSLKDFFIMIGEKVVFPVVELFLRDVIYE